jgi:hypothetical protein
VKSTAALVLVLLGVVVVPLSLRAANRLVVGELPDLGYLPSLEIRRHHRPFAKEVIDDLRYANAPWTFIGDSMLGTRIDPRYLGSISMKGDRNVAFLYHPAVGPVWWYLAFKNQLVPSGEKPRMTFVFFRDTNLTDTMFRLEGLYGTVLDEVAAPVEPDVDRIVAERRKGTWYRLHDGVNRLYQADVAASWMEPAVRRWFPMLRDPRKGAVDEFEWRIEQAFAIENIRADVGADVGYADHPDFARDLPTSVLPMWLRLSREHDLPLCFVRVQRRPSQTGPPAQSPELVKYIADLKAYLEENGAMYHDDTGDPEMTLDLYEDGDHVRDRKRYTDIFRKRLDPLFR